MAGGDITMSRKEITRLELIMSCENNKLSNGEAAKTLGLSRRQAIRIRKRYRQSGTVVLVSKKRGVPSNNRVHEDTKKEILDLSITNEKEILDLLRNQQVVVILEKT